MTESTDFRGWCVVELMGHVTLAGFVSEQELAGSKLLRVDVPETETAPGFSKIIGAGSIYGITPVDEATVREICTRPQRPFSAYQLQDAFERYYAGRLQRELPGIEDDVRRRLSRDVETCERHACALVDGFCPQCEADDALEEAEA